MASAVHGMRRRGDLVSDQGDRSQDRHHLQQSGEAASHEHPAYHMSGF
jgi:hypothetical protein